jgi:predicted transposase/invertase (TIGR01784 family)
MERCLDPKNDLLFKKIFGEHKELLISFLNSLLPLKEGQDIIEIEYLSPEMVPKTELGKFSIVDVRCTDKGGRMFIVEMQNDWSEMFRNRLLINGSKAIVKQMDRKGVNDAAKTYYDLEPVYVLAVVNDEFTDKNDKEWYHHLQIIEERNPKVIIKGLDFVLLELPKFKPETWTIVQKKMAVLWLRFLREVNHYSNKEDLSEDLMENEHIKMAIELCRESALTAKERDLYDQYLDYMLHQNSYKYLEKAIEKSKKTIEEKEKTIEESKKTIEEKEKTIEEKEKTIEEKEKTIEERDEENRKLREELEELKKLVNH